MRCFLLIALVCPLVVGCVASPISEADRCRLQTVERSLTLLTKRYGNRPPLSRDPCWLGHVLVTDLSEGLVARHDATTGAYIDVPLDLEDIPNLEPSSVLDPKDGVLYVADFAKGAIHRFSAEDGSYLGLLFHNTAVLEEPVQLLTHNGVIYAVGNDTQNVVALSPQGELLRNFGGGKMRRPHDAAFDANGTLWVAIDWHHGQDAWLQAWDPQTGTLLSTLPPPAAHGNAMSLVVTPDETLLVADYDNNQIIEVFPDTGEQELFTAVDAPISVRIGPDEQVYVLSTDGVLRFDRYSGAARGALVSPESVGVRPRALMFAR